MDTRHLCTVCMDTTSTVLELVVVAVVGGGSYSSGLVMSAAASFCSCFIF
jgi:hypothetical protein